MNLDLRSFDFVDFGASTGSAIEFAQRYLGGQKGIAIDIDPRKVALLKEKGIDAVQCDASAVRNPQGSVRFAIMSHFLEHLPNLDLARRCLDSALTMCTEFVYVQQPWFDSDEYLSSLGLKLYWSDWHGHSNHMCIEDFRAYLDGALDSGRIAGYVLWPNNRIDGSEHPAIHPAASPIDQHRWTKGVHPPKPSITFDRGVYRELRCFVRLTSARSVLRTQMEVMTQSGALEDVLRSAIVRDASMSTAETAWSKWAHKLLSLGRNGRRIMADSKPALLQKMVGRNR